MSNPRFAFFLAVLQGCIPPILAALYYTTPTPAVSTQQVIYYYLTPQFTLTANTSFVTYCEIV